MSPATVSEQTFGREVLGAATPVLVEFTAAQVPVNETLHELSRAQAGKLKVVRVDVDRDPLLKDEYGVRGLPTLVLFKYGKPVARRIGSRLTKLELEEWIDGAQVLALATRRTTAARSTVDFKLANGLQVVVIPDHRVPVVTHMVWYKVGSADELKNLSGLARFLTHLSLKSLDKIADGDFAKSILQLGGEVNANCYRDATVYWERVRPDDLKAVMQMEADRMVNLRLDDDDVANEREVMLELRRSRVENDPDSRLIEKMRALLYRAHPYGLPELGTARDIALLSLEDVRSFHKIHYAPDKAVLVVSGDVTAERVRGLAEETFGSIAPSLGGARRGGSKLPSQIAARRVTLLDPHIEAARFRRVYTVPGWGTAAPGEVEALHVLTRILSGKIAGRLYRRLVINDKVATDVSGSYRSSVIEAGELTLVALPTGGDLAAVETAIDDVLDDVRKNGVRREELGRAKRALVADFFYHSNDQVDLARRYGRTAVIGRTIQDADEWPAAVSKVSAADVKMIAEKHLIPSRSVTGSLSRRREAKGARRTAATAERRVP